MTLSIIIVSYNVREFLEQALISIERATANLDCEILVADNNSMDGSAEFVRRRFPTVRLIANSENQGFARANNQAIALSRGRYICLINPDTIVQEDTFTSLLAFFESHPRAGLLGCKILNPDGTLQLACRRSFPTPWVAFTKIVGLAAVFPRSRLFGRYNLTYLDEETTCEVEAISGSFMLLRREVVDQVGLLDDAFFMYGEDLDYCFRVHSAGWKIYYVPETRIIHFKGESSKRSPFEQRRLFYEAMRLFVNKHFGSNRAWMPSWALIIAIRMRALAAFCSALLSRAAWPLLDLGLMTLSLGAAIYFRFAPRFPWDAFLIVHAIYSAFWLAALAAQGAYGAWRLSVARSGVAVLTGLVINSAITFFFKEIGFSRLVVLYAGALNLLALPGWRLLLKLAAQLQGRRFGRKLQTLGLHRSVILAGDLPSCEALSARLRRRMDPVYEICAMVLPEQHEEVVALQGIPVYVGLSHLRELLQREKVQEVIFATDRLPYQEMLAVISSCTGSGVSFKLVPSSMDVIIGKASVEYIEDMPLMEIRYTLQSPLYRLIKRLSDLSLASLLLLITWPVWLWLRLVRGVHQKAVPYFNGRQQRLVIHEWDVPADTRKWWLLLPWIAAIWRGEMSFVGPRPERQAASVPLAWALRPGLTSLEEVDYPQPATGEERERSRLYYLKNYSPFLDAEILIKTLIHYGQKREQVWPWLD
ncbi:MAG TPA: glycosyltransferase [bacterium]|nr:glycosyltransferase [bacterium]HQI49146.1 glycosyltransferase [bacterium]HQJ66072.1 glycosyltransferase [bacterium]